MFQKAGHVDLDGDGVGEYGTIGELTAADPLRGEGASRKLAPPLMSPGLRPAGSRGHVMRSGYRYLVFLPARAGGLVVAERGLEAVDPDRAEREWVAFAWPFPRGEGAWRTFRIDQAGAVTATSRILERDALPGLDPKAWTVVR